jgi:alpha-L-arabinofuranosidase
LNNDVVAGQDSLYASACIDAATNELIIKVVNASDKSQSNTLQLEGVKKIASKGKLTVMQSELTALNSFDSPTNVAPVESTIVIKGKKIILNNSPYSFSVLRVKLE